ncbi:MAG: hypothetical protein EU530_02205 [Promethearchaeota archaeon]|nr:MAG: hypothetical protein EU530_02205 [Candidatus Lokiarchaeota archaeon]
MFTLNCVVSWLKGPQTFQLTDIRDIYGTYPTISKLFFQHLVTNIQSSNRFFAESGLKRIKDSYNQEFEAHQWIFLWAEDFRGRYFYILFSRASEYGGNGALAAVGPPEFAEFLRGEGKPAILATLTLLNKPDMVKSVAVVVSSPKEAQEAKTQLESPQLKQFSNWIDSLKIAPNEKGQWFPAYLPQCPVCNAQLVGLEGYEVGFTSLVCPQCGFSKKKVA